MARAPNLLYLSRWAPMLPQSAPVVPLLPLAAALPPPPPVPSPRRMRSVAQLRRNAASNTKQDPDDLIVWDSESSVASSSDEQEQEEDLPVTWDDDDLIVWEYSSSEDGELSEDEVTEDTTSEASTPNERLPSHQAPVATPKDPYSSVTCKFPSCAANNTILNCWKANPVKQPQGGLENSRWAVPAEKPVPQPTTTVPRQPAIPPAPPRPQNSLPQYGPPPTQPLQALPNGFMAPVPPSLLLNAPTAYNNFKPSPRVPVNAPKTSTGQLIYIKGLQNRVY